MAHVFAAGRKWETERESIVDLLISYAMETNREIHYGDPSKTIGKYLRKTIGTQHRLRVYQNALNQQNITADTIKNCSDIYTLGLVEKAGGWDTYKQVFRSYSDKDFTPNTYKYEGSYYNAQTLDFLDRLEYFSGKPGLLNSLPDRGSLLNRLNVTRVERNLHPNGVP